MKQQIIACRTLEDEINYVMKKNEKSNDIIWIESGLHNYPEKLHIRIQEEIDQIKNCEQLILIFGNCGKAVNKLKNGNFQMIVPKFADCISLLFGSDEERLKFEHTEAAYFLTEGWLRGERNIWVEYEYTVNKYGIETAEKIVKMMYGNYRTLALLNSGIHPVRRLMQETKKIEDAIGLKRKVIPVSLAKLEQLLLGPWDDDDFYIIKPYECMPD